MEKNATHYSQQSATRQEVRQFAVAILTEVPEAERINDTLKDHATGIDWDRREIVSLFHTWANRFNFHFKLKIATLAIQLAPLRRRCLGTYQPGRNGFGLRYEITLNSRRLDRALADQLATLLHEMIHAWQELHGRPSRSAHYHNVEFRRKARTLGLVIDARGHHLRVEDGPFTTLLKQHGVATDVFAESNSAGAADAGIISSASSSASTLGKWSCRCTNVWAAVDLDIQCRKCGNVLEPNDPVALRRRTESRANGGSRAARMERTNNELRVLRKDERPVSPEEPERVPQRTLSMGDWSDAARTLQPGRVVALIPSRRSHAEQATFEPRITSPVDDAVCRTSVQPSRSRLRYEMEPSPGGENRATELRKCDRSPAMLLDRQIGANFT